MAASILRSTPVLFAEEVDDSTLLSLDPSKERYEQQLKWEHASESIRIEVDAVFGHHGVSKTRNGI